MSWLKQILMLGLWYGSAVGTAKSQSPEFSVFQSCLDTLSVNRDTVKLFPGHGRTAACAEGYSVVALRPGLNSAYIRIVAGSNHYQLINLPEGNAVLTPFIIHNAVPGIQITNIGFNINSIVQVGVFGLNGYPTIELQANSQYHWLHRYETAGLRAPDHPITLQVELDSADIGHSVLFFLWVGDEPPTPIALNTNPDNLPAQWKSLPNLEVHLNGFWMTDQNFQGKTIMLMNAGLIPVTLRLRVIP